MKPRQLHRSITFWSGIVVIILVLAWCHSLSYTAGFGFSTSERLISTYQHHGEVSFDIHKALYPAKSGNLNGFIEPAKKWKGSFPKPLYELSESPFAEGYRSIVIIIPHWLILAFVALPWSLFLLWRARRISKAVIS